MSNAVEVAAFLVVVSKFKSIFQFIKKSYTDFSPTKNRFLNILHKIEYGVFHNYLNLSESSLCHTRKLSVKPHTDLPGYLFAPNLNRIYLTSQKFSTFDIIRREIETIDALLREDYLLDFDRIFDLFSRIVCIFKLVFGMISHVSFIATNAIDLRIRELISETERECSRDIFLEIYTKTTEGKRLLFESRRAQADYLQFCNNEANESTIFHMRRKQKNAEKAYHHFLKKRDELKKLSQTEFHATKSKFIEMKNQEIAKLLAEKNELLDLFEKNKTRYNLITQSVFNESSGIPESDSTMRSKSGEFRSYFVRITGAYHMNYPKSHTSIMCKEEKKQSNYLDDNLKFISSAAICYLDCLSVSHVEIVLPPDVKFLIASFLFVGVKLND